MSLSFWFSGCSYIEQTISLGKKKSLLTLSTITNSFKVTGKNRHISDFGFWLKISLSSLNIFN